MRTRGTLLGLGLLSSLALLAGCSGTVKELGGGDPVAGCMYGGAHYAVGASFEGDDGCNHCACTAQGVACTTAACAADGGASCQVDGRSYAVGEQVSNDGCNTCACTASGDVACTARACESPAPGRTCTSLREQTTAELGKIRSCNSAAECGQAIEGSSCGCTRDWVARKDADLSTYQSLRQQAISLGCDESGGSTCDCPSADGFACVDHTCTWNYVGQEPPPEPQPQPQPQPQPEPTCQPYAPARVCVRGKPTADGELLNAGDPLIVTVYSGGCFSSSCSKVEQASCEIASGSDFQVKATFCVSDTSKQNLRCTADCGSAHADCSFGQPLTSGEHQVILGQLAVGFQVPSQLPLGGLCAGVVW